MSCTVLTGADPFNCTNRSISTPLLHQANASSSERLTASAETMSLSDEGLLNKQQNFLNAKTARSVIFLIHLDGSAHSGPTAHKRGEKLWSRRALHDHDFRRQEHLFVRRTPRSLEAPCKAIFQMYQVFMNLLVKRRASIG